MYFLAVAIKHISQLKSLSIKIVGFICISSLIQAQAKAQPQLLLEEKKSGLQTSYLESRDELKDYILDTGDSLFIEFVNIPELSKEYTIDPQGEIYFKRIRHTYIRGLTVRELSKLLEKRYEEFLINPEINIKITKFKPIRIAIEGEVRSPGLIKLPGYVSTINESIEFPLNSKTFIYDSNSNINTSNSLSKSENIDTSSISTKNIKNESEYLTTLSNAIQAAGGLTSYSDLSKIVIIRDIPIGQGGGKKRATIDFRYFTNNKNLSNDIRLFDGDNILIPSLQKKDLRVIPNSILTGLTPRFINIEITGQIENPGNFKVPIEGTLSDVMILSGPRKPLSGKIFLFRYNNDGTLLRKSIRYSSTALAGTSRNPYLRDGDLITVKNSILGRASGTLKAISEPFIGVYATKETLENIVN